MYLSRIFPLKVSSGWCVADWRGPEYAAGRLLWVPELSSCYSLTTVQLSSLLCTAPTLLSWMPGTNLICSSFAAGLDTICRDMPMPRLRNGDFVMFPKFGAYTIAGAVNFNGESQGR